MHDLKNLNEWIGYEFGEIVELIDRLKQKPNQIIYSLNPALLHLSF
jgi:hypothetical protein